MKGALAQAARTLKVSELSSKIFGNAFNPTGARTGNYILRQNFRGEHMVRYYPSQLDRNLIKVPRLSRLMGEKMYDPDDIDRLNVNDKRRARGKGTPKKGEGKRATLAKKKKRSGHKGKFGHEFFRFEIDSRGRLRYANNSNYRRGSIIRKELTLSPLFVEEIKRIIRDSEIMHESDEKWPKESEDGRQQLEIRLDGKSIDFQASRVTSLVDIQGTDDPEGLRVLYYLVQDFKCLILSVISLHFKIKPYA
ncbi:hypothetical protein LPJ53_003505 [Coemansia erecta]|uniref:Mago nashi protein n=1 Tax=Coemansia erecta TaxID=147472 RepID=A0A9W8CSP3_9FUNG|nr:hypothetical protein LPJ53_003505 [Coemansia erecta]